MSPVHHSHASNGKDRDNWLKRNKEASKEEQVYQVDILISRLKYHIFISSIHLRLVDEQSSLRTTVIKPFEKPIHGVQGIKDNDDWSYEGIGETQHEDIACQPIFRVNFLLNESVDDDGNQDGVDHLGNDSLNC